MAFKYINGSSWLNRVVFPVTREQYCRDAGLLCPELKENIFEIDPGDVFTFTGGEFSKQSGGCGFVRKLGGDREDLDFSPVTVGNELIETTGRGLSPHGMRETIQEEIEKHLAAFIEDQPSLFTEHYRWKVVYQLTVVFPEGHIKWSFDFSEKPARMQRGRSPLATLYAVMTASGFYGLLKGTLGWDYLTMGGFYRRFNKLYAVTQFGLVQPENSQVRDPLELKFPYRRMLESLLLKEIERWQQIDNTIPMG